MLQNFARVAPLTLFLIFACTVATMMSLSTDAVSTLSFSPRTFHWEPLSQQIGQVIMYQFLHGWILHLLSNIIFLVIFAPAIEHKMWFRTFALFWIFSSIFTTLFLFFFSSAAVVGMSGFCMAWLSFLVLAIRWKDTKQFQAWLIFLFINIAIGFTGNISLSAHLGGAIAGALWFGFTQGVRSLKRR